MKHVHGWAFPDADAFMANEMKPDGSYQAGHLAAALAHVTDWSVAIDGGAHVGTWSKTLSGRFARVLAIEPSPDTFEALVSNLQTFGCLNVEARNIAIGATGGRVAMHLEGRGVELKNTGARFARPGGTIPLETIDSWQLPSLGLLKLDVEGSEAAALRGAVDTLRRCRPIVIFEDKNLWSRYGEPRDAAAKVLRTAGYVQIQRVKMDEIWGPGR